MNTVAKARFLLFGNNVQPNGREIQSVFLLAKRFKATAAPAVHPSSTSTTAADDVEWAQAKPFDQIPGLKSLPVIGTTWSMFPIVGIGANPNQFHLAHQQAFNRFGHIWRDNVPGMPTIVTTARPEDIEKVFRSEGKFPERPGFESLKHYRAKRVEQFTAEGILIAKGDEWWRIRSKAQQPFLKTKNVEHYLPVLGDIAEEFIDRIRLIRQANSEVKPDFINDMYKWALESVAVVGLNTRLGCLDPNLAPDSEAQKMIKAANTSFAAMNEMEFKLPFWKWFETKSKRQLFEAQDFFTDTTIKYISKTMEDIKKRPADSEEDPSILEEILIRGMSPKDAMVMVIDMLMAGIDTTSHTTSFLLYFLAKNPDKQEKLRNEILSVVGPKGSRITAGALNEMHYLKASIKESLRMMPAVLGNARISERDLVLSGYQVPKGSLISTAHQLIGQLDEYFPSAKSFKPERWIKGDPQESHHHRYALLPFGFGTRMCIGRRLAELEMWQLTIKLLQNFKVEYHHGEMGCLTRMVNVPDVPLKFKFVDL